MSLSRAAPSSQQKRRVSLLGATGSVGGSTVALLREQPELYEVQALTAHRRPAELASLAKSLGARLAVIADAALLPDLAAALAGTGIEVDAGPDGLRRAAELPADWVLSAITGAAGLEPTLAALRQGAIVALANKESIVCAGELMLATARRHGGLILPVDSEHNAIFQCLGSRPAPLDQADLRGVERLILTASGGPFRRSSREQMAAARVKDALAHPVWSMGAKISIDSATMMNKGLELIEAHHLFSLPPERIEILVHPQSIVHSMVAFIDGSHLAQLGTPDMRIPIASTLGWPDRLPTAAPRLDLASLGRLDFEPPDPARFPALRLVREALATGGTAPAILNAANEVAVAAFLDDRLGFLDIAELAERAMNDVPVEPSSSIETVLAADEAARRYVTRLVAA